MIRSGSSSRALSHGPALETRPMHQNGDFILNLSIYIYMYTYRYIYEDSFGQFFTRALAWAGTGNQTDAPNGARFHN